MADSSNNRSSNAILRQLEIEYNLLSPNSQRFVDRFFMRGNRVVQRIESGRSKRAPMGKELLGSKVKTGIKKVVDHVDKQTRRKKKRKQRPRKRRSVGK